MILQELRLKNFMCYRGEQPPLSFEGLHVACLAGENGAGKSALLDAITWALWGKARSSDDELITLGEQEMEVEFTFTIGSETYRVIRKRVRAKSDSRSGKETIDVHIKSDTQWKSIGGTAIRENDTLIEHDILHMSYETFINASYLVQGRADEFTKKTPDKRKKVLATILELQQYDEIADTARSRAKRIKEKVIKLDGILEAKKHEAEKRSLYQTQVQDALEKCQNLEKDLEAANAEQQAHDKTVRQLEDWAKRLRNDLQPQQQKLDALIQNEKKDIEKHDNDITAAEELIARQDDIMQGVAAHNAATAQRDHYDDLQPHYNALCEKQRQQQDALNEETRTCQHDIKQARQDANSLRKKIDELPALEQERANDEAQLAQLEPLSNELNTLRQQREQLDGHISRLHDMQTQYHQWNGHMQQQHNELVASKKIQQNTADNLKKRLHDVPTWQKERTDAQVQQQKSEQLATTLVNLRTQEQTAAERAGELRSMCEEYKKRADNIKKRREMLAKDQTTTCPLCQSELGDGGLAHVLASYDAELTELREQYRDAEKERKQHDETVKTVRQDIQAQEKILKTMQKGAARIESLQRQLADATRWQDELQKAETALQSLEHTLATNDYAHTERAEIARITEEFIAVSKVVGIPLAEHTDSIDNNISNQLEERRKIAVNRINELEQQLAQSSDVKSRIAIRTTQITERIAMRDKQLLVLEKRIATLQQTLDTNNYAPEIRAALHTITEQLTQLGYSSAAHDDARKRVRELAHWVEEKSRLEHAQQQLAFHCEMRDKATELCNQYDAERTRIANDITTIKQRLSQLPDAITQKTQSEKKVQNIQKEYTAANNDWVEKQTLLRNSEDAQQYYDTTMKERNTLVQEQSLFDELTEAFGKKGIQAMLIDEIAIPEIEREANDLLGRMTDNQMHVTFETQRPLKTKKGEVSETLDIFIADTLGTRDYEMFSGGEAMRINFAIRIALSRLLARRAGTNLETLIIDEGFGALDTDGRDRFVEAITSVQDSFRCILVITHIDDLKDRFPVQIAISKQQHSSGWHIE